MRKKLEIQNFLVLDFKLKIALNDKMIFEIIVVEKNNNLRKENV